MRPPEAKPSCDSMDAWAPSAMPPLRSGPPYIMAEVIAHEPAAVERLVRDARVTGEARAIAELLRPRPAPEAGRSGSVSRRSAPVGPDSGGPWPPAVVGCGSSEHAALAAAAIWREAWRHAGLPGPGPVARQSFEAAQDPWPGTTIAISHEGGTWATAEALHAARAAGARVGLITAGANGPCASLAEVVLCTRELDPSWCHTLGFLAPLVAAASVGAELADRPIDPLVPRRLVEAGIAAEDDARALGRALATSRTLAVVASGADRPAGRELALKVEEASYVPAAYRDLETLLHGHVTALDVGSGVVLILTDRDGREARVRRACQLLAAVGRVGARCGAIVTAGASAAIPGHLTPAGRIVIPEAPDLPAPAAAAIGSAVPLQLTAYHMALALGTNPDALRREATQYRLAAETLAVELPAAGTDRPAAGRR